MSHNPYKALVCKGSLALNSGCGRCERCKEEQAELAEKSDVHQISALSANMGSIAVGQQDLFDKVSHLGLPVAGYKKVQPPHLVALVNENKVLEEKILRQIDKHVTFGPELDQRAVALARTAIQEAFMWLNRGVFQPSRLDGDLE
jgi:hypothetical protein